MTVIQPVHWPNAGLRSNPFNIEPEETASVWAGMPKLRQRFEQILSEAVHTDKKQVVLNFGPTGGGKTHAALFFSDPNHFPEMDKQAIVQNILPIYVTLPKEPEKSEQRLFINIIETIGFDTIVDALRETADSYSDWVRLTNRLTQIIGSDELAKGLLGLGKDFDEDMMFLYRAYFFQNKSSRSELKKLGIARNIETIEDRFGLLAAILHLLIGMDPQGEMHARRRVMLWIDEMEDLVFYQVRYHRPLTQGIRDLLGRVSNYFTLAMNFTLPSPEALEDIEAILGKLLLTRVTDYVAFNPLSYEEAYEYAVDLLRQYQTLEFTPSTRTFPFTETSLRQALKGIKEARLTPREINKRCLILVTSAMDYGCVSALQPIDDEFVDHFDRKKPEMQI